MVNYCIFTKHFGNNAPSKDNEIGSKVAGVSSTYRKKTQLMSDEEIVRQIISEGQRDLFTVLYDRYSDKVYRKCISFTKEREEAKDLMHDVFLKLFFQLAKFDAKSRFSTWLYSVVYNHCVEYYRKESKKISQELDDDLNYSNEEEDEESELASYRSNNLKKAMEKISAEEKALLLMKYQDSFSLKEMMEVFNISESALKMRLARARQRVKVIIQELESKLV